MSKAQEILLFSVPSFARLMLHSDKAGCAVLDSVGPVDKAYGLFHLQSHCQDSGSSRAFLFAQDSFVREALPLRNALANSGSFIKVRSAVSGFTRSTSAGTLALMTTRAVLNTMGIKGCIFTHMHVQVDMRNIAIAFHLL